MMTRASHHVVLVALLPGVVVAAAIQPPTLPGLLGVTATYVSKYEERISAVVLEERYIQDVNRTASDAKIRVEHRELRSEVVLVNAGEAGWLGFRDVVEVDGKPVHDRQNRLQMLFVNAPAGALDQARAIAAESARFNVGTIQRTVNYPTMALTFLRLQHQQRSTFSRGGSDRIGDVSTWALGFREQQRPSLIWSREDRHNVSGRFWIEPDTGRVWRSQLTIEEPRSSGTYDVRYGAHPGLDVLVPVSMEETLSVRDGLYPPYRPVEVITGRAQYTNFKQFSVDIGTSFGPEAPR